VPKTVTVKAARGGARIVRVGKHTFPVGEPVRDVDDDTIATLKAITGVEIHVAAGKQTKSDEED